jgi:hypothetical protein
MSYIHLVIYATHSDGNFDILVKKARELGYYISIVGWGDKWEGFYKRTLELYDFIKTRPADEIIMCIDGFDSMVLQDVHDTLSTFQSFDSPIVWGIEESNNILRRVLFRSKYSYTLNGGSYIGVNKYLQLVFEEIIEKYGTTNYKQDDQRIVNKMNNSSLLFKELVKPDLESRIFANLIYQGILNTIMRNNKALTYEYTPETVRHKQTGIVPCMISGPGDVNMNEILEQMGYDPKPRQENYYKFFMRNFKMELFCLILFILVMIIGTIYLVKCLRDRRA